MLQTPRSTISFASIFAHKFQIHPSTSSVFVLVLIYITSFTFSYYSQPLSLVYIISCFDYNMPLLLLIYFKLNDNKEQT